MAQPPQPETTAPEKVQTDQEDEIPAYTEVPLTKNKIKKINSVKYSTKRVMSLYVSHLLDTDKVKNTDKLEKHFCMGDKIFRNITIRGVIIGLQVWSFKTKDRVLILVDDGTAVLDCFLEENKPLEKLRSEVVHTKLQNTKELALLQPDNTLLKAALMMLQSSKERINKLPHYKDFRRGDTVELIGNVSEYNGKRTCFISSIIKDSTVGNTRYLEDLDNLYQTAYAPLTGNT